MKQSNISISVALAVTLFLSLANARHSRDEFNIGRPGDFDRYGNFEWVYQGDYGPNNCNGTAQAGDANQAIVGNPSQVGAPCDWRHQDDRYCDAGRVGHNTYVDRYWQCQRTNNGGGGGGGGDYGHRPRWKHLGDYAPNMCNGTAQGGDSNPNVVASPDDIGRRCSRYNVGEKFCDAGRVGNVYIDRYWECTDDY